MATKTTKPPASTGKRSSKAEQKLFRDALKKAGQVQRGGGELKPGVTHVVIEGPGGEVLVRRRFSAI